MKSFYCRISIRPSIPKFDAHLAIFVASETDNDLYGINLSSSPPSVPCIERLYLPYAAVLAEISLLHKE